MKVNFLILSDVDIIFIQFIFCIKQNYLFYIYVSNVKGQNLYLISIILLIKKIYSILYYYNYYNNYTHL